MEPRYNDMPRAQWNYIVISWYCYIETPDITLLLQNNQKYRYIRVKGVKETESKSIGVRAGGAAAPPVSENFGQNAQNSGNEETINKRLN